MLPLSISPLTILTVFTALSVSLIGAYATLAGAHRQFSARVLSTNRQRWIEIFREQLSELLAVMNAAQVIKRASAGHWRGGAGPMQENPALVEKLEKTFLGIAQIQLLTNTAEPDHQALNRAIAEAVVFLQEDELHEADIAARCAEVIELGRNIIRREWVRVKRGV